MEELLRKAFLHEWEERVEVSMVASDTSDLRTLTTMMVALEFVDAKDAQAFIDAVIALKG